jgi:hypothetical protein
MLARLSLMIFLNLPLQAQVDAWGLPPVNYSDTAAGVGFAAPFGKLDLRPGRR